MVVGGYLMAALPIVKAADGSQRVRSSDPGDAEVRTQCAVEAARLRRLMAESDDSATPLLHELHASVDVAERRGVAVDIEVAGLLPDVPSSVRRAITDTVIAVLATAREHARITVTGGADAVVVSLVARSTALPRLPALAGDAGPVVVVDMLDDDGDLWVEARWAAVVPGNVEGVGRAPDEYLGEHRPAVHQPGTDEVRHSRTARAEQGHPAGSCHRRRNHYPGRGRALHVLRDHAARWIWLS